MNERYRTGAKLHTTIYYGPEEGEQQPCAWVPGDRNLAELIVALLNEYNSYPNTLTQIGHAYRVQELETAIRQHRDERGNDRCWLDDARLYAVLGEGQPDTSLPPKLEFLKNCEKFWECRQAKL